MSQKSLASLPKKDWIERGLRRAGEVLREAVRDVQNAQAHLEKVELIEEDESLPHALQSVAHFAVHRVATLFFYGLIEPFWSAQLASAYRFVTLGKTYMSSADIQSARRSLKPGDILAARNEAAATTNFIEWLGSRWTHVAVYLGDGRVLEALDNSGVVETTLPKFMRRYTRVAVYRPSSDWNVEAGLSYGRAQVGKGYNFAFIFNDKSFYCSQLLFRVFSAGGLELASPRRNRMGYPIVNPDELIYDNREQLELVWSAGHEIFRDQGEAVMGISKMTGHMVLGVLAEKGIVLGKQQPMPLSNGAEVVPLRLVSGNPAQEEPPEESPKLATDPEESLPAAS
jgi:uncharacterized protein YycO